MTVRPELRAAAQRIVLLFGGAILGTAVVSMLVGLALGSSLTRAIAVGLYLVGCFLVVFGVLQGVRGPLRPAGKDEDSEPIGSLLGLGVFSRGVRQATGDERADARSAAWLFLGIGIAMILTGIVIDPQTRFF